MKQQQMWKYLAMRAEMDAYFRCICEVMAQITIHFTHCAWGVGVLLPANV